MRMATPSTVSLARHDDLLIDRLVLFRDARSTALARRVQSDNAQLSPTTEVKLVAMILANPWWTPLLVEYAPASHIGLAYPTSIRACAGARTTEPLTSTIRHHFC